MNTRDELIAAVLPVLEKCFDSDWNMTYSEMVTDALTIAGYRKIFDGDCGLSNVKDPTEREAAEAWMRWANLAMNEDVGAIYAMKKMLTELGYRKPVVLGYVVVSREGTMIGTQFSDRAAAQAKADEWTNDCKAGGVDWDYRVAEIVEAGE